MRPAGSARAQRILETEPEDVVERGYLLIHEFYAHLGRGDLARAEETAARVVRVGRRFGAPDLVAQGLVSMGRVAIYLGRVREGLALLDEAMVGISAGEVSPVFAGLVYCTVIEGCQELADISRMSSWTLALTRWCETQPGLVPFTGQCSLHRGQILRLHGAFDDALVEFSQAQHRAETGFRQSGAAAAALRERGDLLRIRGRLADAETAYQQLGGARLRPAARAGDVLARPRPDGGGRHGDPAPAGGDARTGPAVSAAPRPPSRSCWRPGIWTRRAGAPRS